MWAPVAPWEKFGAQLQQLLQVYHFYFVRRALITWIMNTTNYMPLIGLLVRFVFVILSSLAKGDYNIQSK